ncbi:hypothetical protein BST97_01875 [Nonlabens spongiae]|uniref:Cell surface protein n=1 Tax=Nonlabens spongiae TaxID=331648 RepID=A0A1W6MH59_9FLAO|nr:hypothetical protein [Nonlabens spongiae]ARN76846.1 hypothetical protein BST97_01875 [Nonlabens spongiae]
MKKISLLLVLLILASCKNDSGKDAATSIKDNNAIVNFSDFEDHLDHDISQRIGEINTEIDSLKKVLDDRPNNILDLAKVASLLDERFDLKANVEDLNESVRFRESVTKKTAIKPEGAQRMLAQSYIKQHRFKDADSVMKSFTQEYASRESKYVLFDVAMELGRYDEAEKLLDELKNDSDYNYLIRSAKWNDYIGRLDNTIIAMEKALKLAESSGNTGWKLWSYSNIADYYGHDGQVEKSYDHYLKTLEIDPGNTYALKGISWVAFSKDGQAEQALQIINKLQERHPSPDYLLSKAELMEFMGKEKDTDALKSEFITRVNRPEYGEMYNAYLIEELASGSDEEKSKSLEIARKEIENRATPETYDLLGLALLENGQNEEALENHKSYVIGKTFEPVAQMHTAMIYRANGMDDEAEELKKELLEAEYELGPVVIKEVKKI